MATYQQDILEIQAKIKGLPGQKVWGVAIGHGGFLTMEFGRPLFPQKANETIHGEWHLWLYGCGWRLEQKGSVIVASEDERGKMEAETRQLEGCVLESIEVLTPALDAVFTFEGDKVLRLFSLYTEEMDSWMLFTPACLSMTRRVRSRVGYVQHALLIPQMGSGFHRKKVQVNSPAHVVYVILERDFRNRHTLTVARNQLDERSTTFEFHFPH